MVFGFQSVKRNHFYALLSENSIGLLHKNGKVGFYTFGKFPKLIHSLWLPAVVNGHVNPARYRSFLSPGQNFCRKFNYLITTELSNHRSKYKLIMINIAIHGAPSSEEKAIFLRCQAGIAK